MGSVSKEAGEELMKRVIANGGSVGEPAPVSMSQCIKVISNLYANRDKVLIPKVKKPRMNNTETEFQGTLLARHAKVAFEAITLELATGSRYTPDFYCYEYGEDTMGNYCCLKPLFYEVKNNFIREAALVRLKVAARQYPEFTFILAQKKKGVWTETVVLP